MAEAEATDLEALAKAAGIDPDEWASLLAQQDYLQSADWRGMGQSDVAEDAFEAGWKAAQQRYAAGAAAERAQREAAEALLHRLAVAARTRLACLEDGYAPAIESAQQQVRDAVQALLDFDTALERA